MNYNTILHELSLNMNCRLHTAQDISYKIHIAHDTSNASIFYHISTYSKYNPFETWSLLEVFSYSWIVMLNWKVSSYCTTGFRTADILNYFKSIRVRPFHSFVWVFKLSLINSSEARFYGASGSGLKLGSWNWQIASCSPIQTRNCFFKNNLLII